MSARERATLALAGVLIVGALVIVVRPELRRDAPALVAADVPEGLPPAAEPAAVVGFAATVRAPVVDPTAPGVAARDPDDEPALVPWQLDGRVVDGADAPIAGATVRAWAHSRHVGEDAHRLELGTATTDGRGGFAIGLERIAVGSAAFADAALVAIAVEARGFVPREESWGLARCERGGLAARAEFRLERGERSTGRVVDGLGAPVPGATVRLLGPDGTPLDDVACDAAGRYSVDAYEQQDPAPPRLAVAFDPAIGASDPVAFAGVDGVAPTLRLTRGGARIAGRVEFPSGHPVPCVAVRCERFAEDDEQRAAEPDPIVPGPVELVDVVTERDGQFAAGYLVRGRYEVRADDPFGGEPLAVAAVATDGPAVRLVVAASRVTVATVDEHGVPVAARIAVELTGVRMSPPPQESFGDRVSLWCEPNLRVRARAALPGAGPTSECVELGGVPQDVVVRLRLVPNRPDRGMALALADADGLPVGGMVRLDRVDPPRLRLPFRGESRGYVRIPADGRIAVPPGDYEVGVLAEPICLTAPSGLPTSVLCPELVASVRVPESGFVPVRFRATVGARIEFAVAGLEPPVRIVSGGCGNAAALDYGAWVWPAGREWCSGDRIELSQHIAGVLHRCGERFVPGAGTTLLSSDRVFVPGRYRVRFVVAGAQDELVADLLPGANPIAVRPRGTRPLASGPRGPDDVPSPR